MLARLVRLLCAVGVTTGVILELTDAEPVIVTLPVMLIWALGLGLLLGLLLTDELIVGSLVGVALGRLVIEDVGICELLKVLVEEVDTLPDSDT